MWMRMNGWILRRRSAGTLGEDLSCYLKTKTTIWVLNLTGTENNHESILVTAWGQNEKMKRRSLSSSLMSPRHRRRNITLSKKNLSKHSSSWSKGWQERTSWKDGNLDETTSGDSQSSQARWDQGSKKKESKLTEMAKAFYETGLLAREKTSWHTSCKEYQNERKTL